MAAPHLVDQTFHSLIEWRRWIDLHPHFLLKEYQHICVEYMREHGIWEPLTHRFIKGDLIDFASTDLREGAIVDGITSRARAVLYCLENILDGRSQHAVKIYAPEALTPLALLLRGRFPRFLGSEFGNNDHDAKRLYPIPIKDLTNLDLPSEASDIVTTNEVLEHVTDLDEALRELCRVLMPGGHHIGTVPFNQDVEQTDVRTLVANGELTFLKPPEWHRDPLHPESGSLVFAIPAWDIIQKAKSAGFSEASMRFVHSITYGVASNISGVFVLCLTK